MTTRSSYHLRLDLTERARLMQAAAEAGLPPSTLARQFILAGLDAAALHATLPDAVARAITAEIKPALVELARIAGAALQAHEFVDLYGPSYLMLRALAEHFHMPVHEIRQHNREPQP